MKTKLFKATISGKAYYLDIGARQIKSVYNTLAPFEIEIFPFLRCNLNCHTCDRGRESSMLKDFNDVKILHENLRQSAGTAHLTFKISGGEPAIYPRINELIAYLYTLTPDKRIAFVTNGLEIARIKKEHLKKLELRVSFYPYTEDLLRSNLYYRALKRGKSARVLETRVDNHEDMSVLGSVKYKRINALSVCFNAVLLAGTKKVYPCCRAHRLEQMHKKTFHLYINSKDLYAGLKRIITDTDLCRHCPRMYRDRFRVPLRLLR